MNLEEEQIIQIASREDLPVKVLRIVRIKSMDKIPNHLVPKAATLCGAYMIITKYGENYVGSTVDFFRRTYTHKCLTIKGRIPKSAYLYETENEDDAIKLEDWLIYWTNPSLNIIGKQENDCLNDVEISLLGNSLYNAIKNTQRQRKYLMSLC